MAGNDKETQATYIREIELRYRDHAVNPDAPAHEPLTDARKVFELFSDMQNESKEKLITISLDAKMKMLCFEVVAIGSLRSIYVRPFEALRAAIPLNAYGIIMVHNHPSGDPTPSESDKEFTYKLLELTLRGGAEFHDHIIIGKDGYFSFAEHGLMKRLTTKAKIELDSQLKEL